MPPEKRSETRRETPDTSLQDLLALVRAGTETILTEGATPLCPSGANHLVQHATRRRITRWRADFGVSDDFDEELPEAFWTGTA